MKKEIKFLFIIFLLSSFFSIKLVFSGAQEDTSFESGAKQKQIGFTEKERDSILVLRKRFIKDIEKNNIQNIKEFLKIAGPDINFIVSHKHPFVHAANINNFEVLKFFLNETEININSTDELGNTALIKASEKGNIEIVNYLINNNADVDYQNKQGLTPAMKAAERNNFNVVKLLLDKNIDITKSDYTGRTLKEIAENSRDKRILKLLN